MSGKRVFSMLNVTVLFTVETLTPMTDLYGNRAILYSFAESNRDIIITEFEEECRRING